MMIKQALEGILAEEAEEKTITSLKGRILLTQLK